MAQAGWVLIAASVACVYLAVILATVDGLVRAFRERYVAPWMVGLVATLLLAAAHQALGSPFGSLGGILAIPAGIAAGAAYGLSRRTAQT